ncbi:MAG: hypothetical protein ACKVG7_08355 [Flavobacteriales bacterium]
MKKLIYLAGFCLLITSCSKTHRNALTAIPGVSITTQPIPADVIVDKRKTLQGTSVTTTVLGIFKSGDTKFADAPLPGSVGSLEKQAAIYKALEGTDFDVLVNPKYVIEIEKNLFVKTVTATVVGYGAKIKIR